MSELRLFTLAGTTTKETKAKAFISEKEIQKLFETNLESLLGVRFVTSEFGAGPGNRIDTLGLDENNFPVVIEYKLDKHPTVINQGVAYANWIKNNRAEFWKIVSVNLGKDTALKIEDSVVRLICIAADFTNADISMYELMPDTIDLVRYRRFGDGHLLLERITSKTKKSVSMPAVSNLAAHTSVQKSVAGSMANWLANQTDETISLLEAIRKTIVEQGDDITGKETKVAISFRRTRNFASLTSASKGAFYLYLRLNPDEVKMRQGLRDVSKIGHWGTGDLEVTIKSQEDVEAAIPLIARAYEGGHP